MRRFNKNVTSFNKILLHTYLSFILNIRKKSKELNIDLLVYRLRKLWLLQTRKIWINSKNKVPIKYCFNKNMTPFILSGIGKKVPHCMTFVHEDKGSILDLIKTNCLILQPTFLTFHGIKVIFDLWFQRFNKYLFNKNVIYMQHKLRLDNESIPVIWNQFDVFSKSINKNENENHNVIVNGPIHPNS